MINFIIGIMAMFLIRLKATSSIGRAWLIMMGIK